MRLLPSEASKGLEPGSRICRAKLLQSRLVTVLKGSYAYTTLGFWNIAVFTGSDRAGSLIRRKNGCFHFLLTVPKSMVWPWVVAPTAEGEGIA